MFHFTLAKELGYSHPDYLLENLSCKQLIEWQIFYNHKPFGDDLGFYQVGIIASTIANVNLRKGKKPLQPKDFIPEFGKKPEEAWERVMRQLTSMASIKVKKKKGKKKKNGKHRKHNRRD
jgi:hypothetical protein